MSKNTDWSASGIGTMQMRWRSSSSSSRPRSVGQAPGAHAAGHALFERGVVGFLRAGVLLVAAVQAIEEVGGVVAGVLVGRAEVHRHAVVAVLAEDAQHRLVHLVDLEPGAVGELLADVAVVLGAGHEDEAAVLHALQADLALILNGTRTQLPPPPAIVDLTMPPPKLPSPTTMSALWR
jgi:hypothetical protein